jgi:outer membrane protein assembly factor BamB
MAMTGPVIELDRERAEVPLEGPALPPRWWRPLAVALAALLSGTGLVASVPDPGSRLVEVARIDPAYVVTMRTTGSMLAAVMLDSGPHLEGFRLADGARLWSVPLDFSTAELQVGGQLEVVHGVVLLGLGGVSAATRTLAVDSASGQELWRSDLPPVFGLGSGGSVVLAAYVNPDGQPGDQVYQGTTGPWLPLLLRAVDARTGRQVWTYQVPAGWQTALPADPAGTAPANGFVVVSPDGRATVVDLATGARRASATIDTTAVLQRGLGELPTWFALGVYGDLLALVTVSGGRPALAAYRLDTLGPRWTSTASTLNVNVGRCGVWLCMSDGHGVNAIAMDTGAPAWSLADAGHFKGWADEWRYDEPYPVEPDDATLVDPLTRRVVLHLGRWRIPEPWNTGPVLMMLAERDANRTWLGLLAAGPGVDILGAMPDLTLNSCEVGDAYLTCLTTAGQIRVWRYRR